MHRINVNVIEMFGKIGLVADCMFPEPPLPDALLILQTATFVSIRSSMCLNIGSGKPFFDQTPSR